MRLKFMVFLACFFLVLISLNYVQAQSSIETEFSTSSASNYFCDNTGRYWWLGGIMTSSMNDCYKTENVDPYSSNTCCPDYYGCNINLDKCELSLVPIIYCFDYKNQHDCDLDIAYRADYDIASKIEPLSCLASWHNDITGCDDLVSDCECFWNSTVNPQRCQSSYTLASECPTGTSEIAKCVYDTKDKGNCTAGFRLVEWTASWTPADAEMPEGLNCSSDERQVKCLFSELSFFTTISIIIFIALIIIFYILLNKKNRKRKKKK